MQSIALEDDTKTKQKTHEQTFALWQRLTARLADELARGYSLTRIIVEAEIMETDRPRDSLSIDRLRAWSVDRARMCESRHIGKLSEAEKIEQKLTEYFNELDRLRDSNSSFYMPFVEISVTRKIWGALNDACDLVKPFEIFCAPGMGKSESALQYQAAWRKKAGFNCPVWIVTMGQTTLTLDNLLNAILCVIDPSYLNKHPLKRAEAMRMIISKTEGRGGLLIIDEGQHIEDANLLSWLSILDGIREFTDGKYFGVAILSNGEIYRRASSGKHIQLARRMKNWVVNAGSATNDDIDLIMLANNLTGINAREFCVKEVSAGGIGALKDAFIKTHRQFGELTSENLLMLGRL